MKKYIGLLCVFSGVYALAQNPNDDAWLYFKDKPSAQAFLDDPSSVLSQRSLDRREAQAIDLDITDAPIEESYYTTVQNTTGISILAKSRWLNAVHVRGAKTELAKLIALPFAQKLVYATKSAAVAFGRNSGIENTVNQQKLATNYQNYTYGAAQNQVEMMNVQQLHQAGFTGQGKLIAVLDSGFTGVDTAPCFQNLSTRNAILDTYNFVLKSNNVYTGHDHGTVVLSTMSSAFEPQMVGTAPNANYLLYVSEDIASETVLEESYWVEAAERADAMGADIINSSLGYSTFDRPGHSYRYQDLNGEVSVASQAAGMLLEKGIIATISAGNSGDSNKPYIGVPADAKNVFAVGGVNPNRSLASFSSIGPSADQRIKPDLSAMGTSCAVCRPDGSIALGGGTSFASPILSGAIASFWSKFPNKTAEEIMEAVRLSAHLAQTPDNRYGYGIPDFGIANSLLNTKDIHAEKTSPHVFPGLFDEFLHINNPNSAHVQLSIYSANGSLQHQQNKAQSIDTKNWNLGAYYYKLQLGQDFYYGKLIKK